MNQLSRNSSTEILHLSLMISDVEYVNELNSFSCKL